MEAVAYLVVDGRIHKHNGLVWHWPVMHEVPGILDRTFHNEIVKFVNETLDEEFKRKEINFVIRPVESVDEWKWR